MTYAKQLADREVPCLCEPCWTMRGMHAPECCNEEAEAAILEAMAYERERCAQVADERCGPKVCHQDAAARIRALPPAPEVKP